MESSCMPKETCIKHILNKVEKGLHTWFEIVETLGLNNAHLATWQNDLIGEFNSCINECNQIAQNKQQALIEKIETLLQKSQDLCKKLSIKMPQFTSTDKGLYNDEQYLMEQIKIWQDEITLRSTEIEALIARRDEICKSLGTNLFIQEDPLPSREAMIFYEKKIEELETEKSRRVVKFITLQREIALVAMEIEFTPNLNFEKNIVYGIDVDEFQLSNENMLKLTEFHEEILKKREDLKLDLLKLKENVQHLWGVLDENPKYCTDFIQQYIGINYTNFDAFKNEVKRCEEIRKSNIKIFIVKLRKELLELWDQAGYPIARREEFKHHMEDDLYTEDLLTLHDLQIERVKQYLKANQKIFDLLKQREVYYDKMRDLEKREYAPDRFKNRGGQLLREEKERKAITKKIPAIEDKLLELAFAYEVENREKFLYKNDTLEALIEKDRENMGHEKQQLLNARKQKRELTPNNLGKSKIGRSALTPHNLRTPNRTPKTAPVKKTLLPHLSITKAKQRLSTEKKKRISALRSNVRKQQLFTVDDDYSKFDTEISRRALRSTSINKGNL